MDQIIIPNNEKKNLRELSKNEKNGVRPDMLVLFKEKGISTKRQLYTYFKHYGYFLPALKSKAITINSLVLSKYPNDWLVYWITDFDGVDIKEIKLNFGVEFCYKILQLALLAKKKNILPYKFFPDKLFLKYVLLNLDGENHLKLFTKINKNKEIFYNILFTNNENKIPIELKNVTKPIIKEANDYVLRIEKMNNLLKEIYAEKKELGLKFQYKKNQYDLLCDDQNNLNLVRLKLKEEKKNLQKLFEEISELCDDEDYYNSYVRNFLHNYGYPIEVEAYLEKIRETKSVNKLEMVLKNEISDLDSTHIEYFNSMNLEDFYKNYGFEGFKVLLKYISTTTISDEQKKQLALIKDMENEKYVEKSKKQIIELEEFIKFIKKSRNKNKNTIIIYLEEFLEKYDKVDTKKKFLEIFHQQKQFFGELGYINYKGGDSSYKDELDKFVEELTYSGKSIKIFNINDEFDDIKSNMSKDSRLSKSDEDNDSMYKAILDKNRSENIILKKNN